MVTVTGKELLKVKQTLDLLNEAYPTASPGVPVQKWLNNKLTNAYSKRDPYFVAYKSVTGVWWVCTTDYGVWENAYDVMKMICTYLHQELGCIAHPCFQHQITIGIYKQYHMERKCFLVGDASWCKPVTVKKPV